MAEDSGRFYSKDDDAAVGERARAKRASNAGGAAGRRTANDPMLPEKKRARRRLVGAIALALAAAVGLPMLLDSEPKPLAGDIAIQIPSKDKAAPLPVPGEAAPGVATTGPANDLPATQKAVAAADSVDKDEEIIDAPGVATPPPPVKAAVVKQPDPKPETVKPEHKDNKAAEARLAERAERERIEKAARAERERLERERADKAERAARLDKQRAEEKARLKAEDKPVKPVSSDARALAILEGKPAAKDKEKDRDADKPAEAGGAKVTLQVAAMSSQDKAADLQARLRGAGISSHTEKFGDLIRVKVGPLSKEEAAAVRAKLAKLGL